MRCWPSLQGKQRFEEGGLPAVEDVAEAVGEAGGEDRVVGFVLQHPGLEGETTVAAAFEALGEVAEGSDHAPF